MIRRRMRKRILVSRRISQREKTDSLRLAMIKHGLWEAERKQSFISQKGEEQAVRTIRFHQSGDVGGRGE